jgi:hypothetical protein
MALRTITADGTTSDVTLVPGRRYVWHIAGTWDGATVILKWYDGTTAVAYADATLTADGAVEFVAISSTVQVVMSSAGTTSLKLDIVPITMRR